MHRSLVTIVAAAALAIVLAGCGERSEPTGELEAVYPATGLGAGDLPVVLDSVPQRIVAVDAGSVELIEALGAGERVVGVPAGSTLESATAPVEVVKETGQIDVDAIAGLEPDLVVATPEIDRVTLSQIEGLTGAPVYIQPSRSVEDVLAATLELGFLIGQPVEARQLAGSIKEAAAAVDERIAGSGPVEVFLDRGFFITIPDDSLPGDLIARAGGINIASGGVGSGPFPLADLLAADPDVYLTTSDSEVTLEELRADPETKNLQAVREGRVVVLPVELVTRAGPRVAEGLQAVAAERGAGRTPEAVREAFRAEAAYYRPRSLEGRDPDSLAALRSACVAVFLDRLQAQIDPNDFVEPFLGALAFRVAEGARETLDALRAAGLVLACVANWDIGLHEHLRALALDHHFELVLTSAEAGAAKPDPAIFALALERLLVRPERALHIGDEDADRDGALSAGLLFEPAPLATLTARLGL
jgi:iron complex transport system substrate-binding protein